MSPHRHKDLSDTDISLKRIAESKMVPIRLSIWIPLSMRQQIEKGAGDEANTCATVIDGKSRAG